MTRLIITTALLVSLVLLHPAEGIGCGQRRERMTKRVIGGEFAKPNSWPWQAQLLKKNSDGEFELKCGGALVDDQWIVTTASCVFDEPDETNFKIILGDHDRTKVEDSEQHFTVERIYPHLRFFTDQEYGYDIALVKLSRKATITDKVATVCLPQQGERVAVGTNCFLTGWGKTKTGKDQDKSDILKEASLPVVSKDTCVKGNSKFKFTKVDDESMLCAGNGGKSIVTGCSGDGGGPFVCEEGKEGERHWVLHGVGSWSDPACGAGTTYSVFARMSTFVDWIKETTASPPPKPPKPESGVCKDYHDEMCGSDCPTWCPTWESSGFCTMPWFKKRMEVYCYKTCTSC